MDPEIISAVLIAVILALYRFRKQIAAVIRECVAAYRNQPCNDGEGYSDQNDTDE